MDKTMLQKWTANKITDVSLIRETIENFSLPGRKIRSIHITGTSYFHHRDDIEDYAYRQLQELEEDERQIKSNYKNIASDMQFPCAATIDEPFIIVFEDDDAFEIDILHDGNYRISMNDLPRLARRDFSDSNVMANILLSSCIGQVISDVEFYTFVTDKEPFYGGSFSEPPYEREFISDIVLRFTDGTGLRFGAWADYGQVDYIDIEDNHITIPFVELKQGLYNWEDVHEDAIYDFQAESNMLFFGQKGEYKVEQNYMYLFSSQNGDDVYNADSYISISIANLLPLDWCITHSSGDWFDEYNGHNYPREKWFKLLDEAEHILSYATFDELFDELVAWNIAYDNGQQIMLQKLNQSGVRFWRKKDEFLVLIKDLRRWSELVLGAEDSMMLMPW